MPTQNIPGIEPIVVQAIEKLFPNIDDQKYAFNYVLAVKELLLKGLVRCELGHQDARLGKATIW